ncbi:uncharacterized protein YqhQ [Caldicoprobacter guelmensis]|uniref:DUF1385 domain-containing protein n=1 Tax=Caldicoprobacter guelmensis TaxID=1170224 RepID=UPI00195B4D31|nr:DUF1385 domain-containing protein [Caldicoprobacter guelmensis]MBM7582424.1 uncharacterized protein YqhQ [Caldicoprobacter guelmensis]
MRKCDIGGQAVLEGVMMRAPSRVAVAVRRYDGEIVVHSQQLSSLKDRHPIFKLPIIRGIVTFVETLVVGIKSLMASAEMYGDPSAMEDYRPSRFEKFVAEKTGKKVEDVMSWFALLLAVGLAIVLFVVVPAMLTGLLKGWVNSRVALGLIEGLMRLIIFIGYIVLVARIKDIHRVFQYHGAEHKTIHCYEHGEELSIENVRKYSTLHPRCGTAFLLVVMVVGIVAFSALSWDNVMVRILIKILLLPLVAGVSYEIIKWAGRTSWPGVRLVMFPGLMLQKLTTREPDDAQLEVAIRAFVEAAGLSGKEA